MGAFTGGAEPGMSPVGVLLMMPQIRAAVRSCTAPGSAPETHTMSPPGLAMTCRFIPCLRCLPE